MPAKKIARSSIYFILLLAFTISFYRLDARTFHGDELNSVVEALNLGQNPNGILYFVMMHYWQRLGASEMWLRVPAAFFAVAAVALSYRWGTALIDRRAGLALSLMMATAPFVIDYAQQDRFYTFFLFAATGAYVAFTLYLKKSTPERKLVLILSNILVVGAHFFGLLVILSEVLWVFLVTKKLSPRIKWISSLAAISIFLFLLLTPTTQVSFYNIFARWTNPYGDPIYTGARGISLAQLAKVPFTFFFFAFGEHVYPLDLVLVVPGAIILCAAGIAAIWYIARFSPRLLVWLVPLFTMPPLLYLVFDPLSPPTLQGAGPRYLIFLIPLFYLLIAASARTKIKYWLVGALVLVNACGLWSYWFGDWAYTDDRVDWRQVREWLRPLVKPATVILLDGPSQSLADYYFLSDWQRTWLRADGEITQLSNIIVVAYNWHPEARVQNTSVINTLERQRVLTDVWSQYPLFIYAYGKKREAVGDEVDQRGRVDIPTEIYGLEFQDIRLPIRLRLGAQSADVFGAFGLPRLNGANDVTLQFADPPTARRILLVSNIIDAPELPLGTTIANLMVATRDGAETIPLRARYETNTWDRNSCIGSCRVAFQWRKRLALVGLQGYPDAWRDFDASIFSSELDLNTSSPITSIQFTRLPSPGKFYVWGIFLEP